MTWPLYSEDSDLLKHAASLADLRLTIHIGISCCCEGHLRFGFQATCYHPSSRHTRWNNVISTLIQRIDVESTLNRPCMPAGLWCIKSAFSSYLFTVISPNN